MSLLRAENLQVHYPAPRGGLVRAVDGVDLTLHPGETVALVGESGCGKSSLGRALLRLEDIAGGTLTAFGQDITHSKRRGLRTLRQQSAMIFQDPRASLNPRMTIAQVIEEPLRIQGVPRSEWPQRVAALLERVGLPPERAQQRPAAFSGGQLQRVGIARALALDPKLIVADEAVSALDVSVQAGIVNLLLDLQQERGIAYLFIAHDLKLVELMCDRVVVMYLGRVVESGPAAAVFGAPKHPYTQALLGSVPHPDPLRVLKPPTLVGELPSPLNPPSGCAFHPRCSVVRPECHQRRPEWQVSDAHGVACFAHSGPMRSGGV